MNCFMCKGNLEEKKVNYVVDLEDTIIIIKGVPAKVCTQCGEQYFDDETAENIDLVINFLMIAKYFERIGDHAVNICEWVEFNQTGSVDNYRLI